MVEKGLSEIEVLPRLRVSTDMSDGSLCAFLVKICKLTPSKDTGLLNGVISRDSRRM